MAGAVVSVATASVEVLVAVAGIPLVTALVATTSVVLIAIHV